jgi:rhodanese-related sulfurtransferase
LARKNVTRLIAGKGTIILTYAGLGVKVSVNEVPWFGQENVPPEQVHEALTQGRAFRILDVRTHPEFAAYHIPGAMLAPIDTLAEELDTIDHDTDWVVVCEHGIRSRAATEFLRQAGYDRVCNMLGGMSRWPGPVETGFPPL